MVLQLLCQSAFILITMLYGTGARPADKMCNAFSTAGTVVQFGSSFVLYCVFYNKVECEATMYLDKKGIQGKKFNATTLVFDVKNISANRTFACKCDCCLEPCGLDLLVGYPPDKPQNLICAQVGLYGNITCTWNTGRDPYIETLSRFNSMVQSSARNNTISLPPIHFAKGSASITIPTFGSHFRYSVWVTASNKLGNTSSDKLSFWPRDIVKLPAPQITDVQCHSLFCVLRWKAHETSQHLEVRHRGVNGAWVLQSSTGNTKGSLNISNLEPFVHYEFQTRCKLNSNSSVWSEWSNSLTSRTDEDVPIKQLDVWYTAQPSGSQQKLYKIFWKELSVSEARGVVLRYKVKVEDQLSGTVTENTTTGHSYGPIACSRCTFAVTAYTSKGSSPVSHIALPLVTAEPFPQNVNCMALGLHSLAISWWKPDTAKAVLGYLIEWFRDDSEKQDFGWKRASSRSFQMNITEIRLEGCYSGAVYALYPQGLGRQQFLECCSWVSAPAGVLKYRVNMWDNRSVTVAWEEPPMGRNGSCPTKYKICLETDGRPRLQSISVASHAKEFTTQALSPGKYRLWMAVWCREEPPQETIHSFSIEAQQQENQGLDVILTIIIIIILLLLGSIMCLSLIGVVRQRLSAGSQMIPGFIPDPANSKWAKECAAAKGQLLPDWKLNLYSLYDDDDKHSTIAIQEDPELSVVGGNLGGVSPVNGAIHCLSHSPSTEPRLTPDPKSQYHSDSHSLAHPELSTHPNIIYIPSNGLQDTDSEEEDEEDDFLPCPQSPFTESGFPWSGGELTLEDIKVNSKNSAE